MKVRGYITHKSAEKFSDCADYFGICPQTKRVAVSDGVSQSIMPLEWAKILVNAYVDKKWEPKGDLRRLKQQWLDQAESFLKGQKDEGIQNWMLENSLSEHDGAGATFCGISFSDGNNWSASILGDTCLVSINKGDNHIVDIFASNKGDFDNCPDYFDSFNEKHGEVKSTSGVLGENDILLLVSDPFSELFQKVQGTENESDIIGEILELQSFDEFSNLIDELRDKFGMHNDDSTLVIVEYDGTDNLNITDAKPLDILIQEEEEEETNDEEELWREAREKDTVEGYDKYLSNSRLKHHHQEARKQIELLKQDKEDWEKAVAKKSEDEYKRYINIHPQGKYVKNAEDALAKMTNKPTNSKTPEVEGEEKDEPASEDPVSIDTSEKKEINEIKVTDEQPSGCFATIITPEIQSGKVQKTKTAECIHEKTDSSKEYETEKVSGDNSETTIFSKGDRIEKCKHKKKMGTEVEEPNLTLRMPVDVDSSDGINLEEFRKLQEIAEQLFNKHLSSFDKAFAMRKWKTDRKDNISKCFRSYWLELGELIFRDNNNGKLTLM